MTSVLSTLNPLFGKNQTLTRSIYTNLNNFAAPSVDAVRAVESEDGRERLAFAADGTGAQELVWSNAAGSPLRVRADGTLVVDDAEDSSGAKYLKSTDMSAYETKANAQTTYLAKADAATTYATQGALAGYLTLKHPTATTPTLAWETRSAINWASSTSYTCGELTLTSSQGKYIVKFADGGSITFGDGFWHTYNIDTIFYTRLRFSHNNSTYGHNTIDNVLNSTHLANYDASTGDNFLYTAKATEARLANYLALQHPTATNTSTWAWATENMVNPATSTTYTGVALNFNASRGKKILSLLDNGNVKVGDTSETTLNTSLVLYTRLGFGHENDTYGFTYIHNALKSSRLRSYTDAAGDNLLYTAKATETRLANYLTTASAASDYLTKAEAASTYATTGSVGNYLSKSSEPTSSGTRFTVDWFMNENNAPYFAIKYGEAPIMMVDSDWLSCAKFVVNDRIRFQNSYATYGANDITNVLTSAHLDLYDATTADNFLYTAKATEATINSKLPTITSYAAYLYNINNFNSTIPATDTYNQDMCCTQISYFRPSASKIQKIQCYFKFRITINGSISGDKDIIYNNLRAAIKIGDEGEFHALNIWVSEELAAIDVHISGVIFPAIQASTNKMLRLVIMRTKTAGNAWTLTSSSSYGNRLIVESYPRAE